MRKFEIEYCKRVGLFGSHPCIRVWHYDLRMLDIFKGFKVIAVFDHLIFEIGNLWKILEQITSNNLEYEIKDI